MPEADLDDVPEADAVHYACRDADATLRIYPVLSAMIDAANLRGCYYMDMAVIPMVERMQTNGMRINVPHFKLLEAGLTARMNTCVMNLDRQFKCGANFNPNSGDQVADFLFSRLNLKGTKFTKSRKRLSTNDKVLEAMRSDSPAVPLILDYREFSKARDSFCVIMPRLVSPDGRIRCNLRVTRVSSGRLAASVPNLLAVPVRSDVGKAVRQGFMPDAGYAYGSWDLDQAEMRYMADESRDEKLCKIFREGKIDVHTQTASWMFGKKPEDVTKIERYAAKRIGFGVITGITEVGLYDQMALAGAAGWTVERCAEGIKGYFEIYNGVARYMEACRAEARRYGFVRDRWGRTRHLPGVWSRIDNVRSEAERQAHSHKIQSGAQGILKRAMAAMWPWMQEKQDAVRPLLQIHDSMLLEVRAEGELMDEVDTAMEHYMTQTTQLTVPMRVKGAYGDTWGDLD
jgi:DNA polymerase I